MSARAARAGGRRRRGGHGEEHESDERWLLTYADMITLLMALFMVLFSISSVNVSKLETLQTVLQEAFSGKVLPGGESVRQTAAGESTEPPVPEPPVPSIVPPVMTPQDGKKKKADADRRKKEQDELEALKRKIDAYARAHGLQDKLQTTIAQRGLIVRILTDRVLFDSGSAEIKPAGKPLLAEIGKLIVVDALHPLVVEGHTDSQPIASELYPSNWELSGARSSSVVRFLIQNKVRPGRLEAAGYAHLRPIASNGDAAGRARNRRVEIVVLRRDQGQGGPEKP